MKPFKREAMSKPTRKEGVCVIAEGDFPYLFDNEADRKRLAAFKPTTERIEIDAEKQF